MPRLPPVRGHRAPGAGQRVCQNREGPVGVHQPAADQHPPQRGGGRRGRHVRRAAGGGAVLADARCAVPAPGRLGQARPAARPADCDCPARRRGPGEAGRLPEWRRGTQGGRGRRAARGTVRCPCHSLLLYRGRPARRGTLYAGSDAARAGLDLRRAHPRDSSPPPPPLSKPSFLYPPRGHVLTRAAPPVPPLQQKGARGPDGRRGLAAARRGVKLGLISATVAPHSSRLRWPTRGWSAPAYRALDRIGTISEEDGERLELLGARPETIAVTGDTRYDSVAERAERLDKTREPLARLAATGPDTFTIVAGSTWPSDEAVILPAFADLLHQLPSARLLLAPHEPNPDHLAGIAERLRHLKLPRPVRLSQLEHAKPGPVIVVDRVGCLADLYALGDTAFVGGGFHPPGLHP